jgi:hypothetical protein
METLLQYLKGQEQPVKDSTDVLVQRTGLSKRQVERALLLAKQQALVAVTNSTNPAFGTWSNQRFIYVTQQEA